MSGAALDRDRPDPEVRAELYRRACRHLAEAAEEIDPTSDEDVGLPDYGAEEDAVLEAISLLTDARKGGDEA